jgi:beta-glucosidase
VALAGLMAAPAVAAPAKMTGRAGVAAGRAAPRQFVPVGGLYRPYFPAVAQLMAKMSLSQEISMVEVSATITNAGQRAGRDVAGEPPRQLAGFQRVTLAPGASAQVSFTLTPQQESWWDDSANGWTQTEGAYNVYLGDSSALSGLPLQGTFTMTATPAARQVVITAPSTMQPGQAATVQVQLTASGDQTLPDVQLALQLPEGWTAVPTGPTEFTSVAPGTSPAATFQVTPPSYAPNASAVVHATATMGNMTREAGATVTVG